MAKPKAPADKPGQLAKLADVPAIGGSPEPTEVSERPAHWFKPGQSGNPGGRPKGSRQRLATRFVDAMHDDFKLHGVATIQQLREDDPGKYLELVARIVPKDVDINVNASDAFVRMWELVAAGTHAALTAEDDEQSEARH